MTTDIQLLRSSVANKRPALGPLLDGQAAVNINATEPGLFFKDSAGTALIKIGPVAVNTTGVAPNANPAGSAGNAIGETWLDGRAAFSTPVMKVWNGTVWNESSGFEVDDTTGNFTLDRVMTLRSMIANGTADFSHITVPNDTTANRPSTPASGMFRFNTTLSNFEGYDGTTWRTFAADGGSSTLVDLTVTGNTVLGDDCSVDTLTINSVTTLNCDATIGANNTNTLAVNSVVASDVNPDGNGTRSLGAAGARWNIFGGDVNIDGNTILGDDTATDTVAVNAELTQNGATNFLDESTMWNRQQLRFSAAATPSAAATFISLRAPATLTTGTVLTLPDGDGAANQVLTTDGSGNLSWSTNGGSTSPTFVDLTVTGNTILGDSCASDTVTINATTTVNCDTVLGSDAANHTVSFAGSRIASNVIPSTNGLSALGSATARWDVFANDLNVDGNTTLGDSAANDTVTVNAALTQNGVTNFLDDSTMWNRQEMRFSAAATPSVGATFMAFRAPATVTTSTTLTLPDGDGSANQVLQTDGSGNLSWVANGSAGGSPTFIDLTVTGDTILGDSCADDTLTVNSVANFNCNVTFGDNNTDTITFTGRVDSDILPSTDNTSDLGSATQRWANIFTGDLHLANDRGDWTVIEEADYLSLRNNKTGKTFKIMMEEV